MLVDVLLLLHSFLSFLTHGLLEKAATPEGRESTPAPKMFLTRLNVAVDADDPLFPSPVRLNEIEGTLQQTQDCIFGNG